MRGIYKMVAALVITLEYLILVGYQGAEGFFKICRITKYNAILTVYHIKNDKTLDRSFHLLTFHK